MEDDFRVANNLCIKRGCLVLEDFIFFSLDLFSCIAKRETTSNKGPTLGLSCSLEMHFDFLVLVFDITFSSPISPMSDTAHYKYTVLKLFCILLMYYLFYNIYLLSQFVDYFYRSTL